MGHKNNRKQQRRSQRGDAPGARRERWAEPSILLNPDIFLVIEPKDEEWASNTLGQCGSCKEFVEDAEGGRGTCLHPGSGVLSPWSDTEACAFFDGRRGARMAARSADSWGA